jgi:hyperosmotically inducible protein
MLTTKVKAALLADPSIKSLDVKVETVKGGVQLSGFVNDQKQIDQAALLARGVSGVTSVDNKLVLKP